MNQPCLVLSGLSKGYGRARTRVEVLENLSLEVPAGQVTLVQGRSGVGKSTLLGLMAGLDAPDSGSIAWEGRELTALDQEALALWRRDHVGYLFQDFRLITGWTALENVEAPLMHGPLGPAERRRRAADTLARFGLADRLDHRSTQLSIGQQQRVALARALVNRPRLVFADEPTGGVDPETGAEVVDLLVSLVRDGSTTLVVASHGLFPVDRAHRLYHLGPGGQVRGPAL